MALHLIQTFSILSPPPLTPVLRIFFLGFFLLFSSSYRSQGYNFFHFYFLLCCMLCTAREEEHSQFLRRLPSSCCPSPAHSKSLQQSTETLCVERSLLPSLLCVCLSLFRESEGKKELTTLMASRIERIARVPNFSCNTRFPSSVMFGREEPKVNVFLCRMFCASIRVMVGCVGNVNPDDDIENIDVNVTQVVGMEVHCGEC